MLPSISIKYYDFEINNKIIEFRAWKTKDEKDYLIYKETKDNISEKDLYDYLIKPCLKNPDIKLSIGERQMLLTEIRKKSFGDDVNIRFVCNSCGKYNETQFSLSEMIQYKPYDFKPVTHDGITITFKEFTGEILEKDLVTKNFVKFLSHIDFITYDNKTYKDFSMNELTDFFNNLDSSTFDSFFNDFTQQIETINYDAEAECFSCKHKQKIDLGNVPNFFPW